MTIGKSFWGFFLVTIGVLLLLDNLKFSLSFDAGDYWGAGLILIGIAMLIKQPVIRSSIAALAGIFLALIVFNLFSCDDHVRVDITGEGDGWGESSMVMAEDFSGVAKEGKLRISGGVAKINVSAGDTRDLYRLKTEGFDADANVSYSADSSQVELNVAAGKAGLSSKREASLLLNPSLVWNITLETGASSVRFDLQEMNVASLRTEAGASTVSVRLGDRQELTEVEFETGASTVKLEIPETVGTEIITETPLSSQSFKGFEKKGQNRFITPNFNDAAKKARIKLSGGVSSFSVSRY